MIKNVILPFKTITSTERALSVGVLLAGIVMVWSTSNNAYIPSPVEIIKAFPRLGEKDIVRNFLHSLFFTFQSIGYATLIGLVFCYLSVLPMFSIFCQFMRKFRFLPSAGLSFLFMKMTDSIDQQMLWMMVWGISTWLIDGMIGVALSISKEDVMYAKSLRLSRWKMMRELLIYGKAADLLKVVISNFAIAWMLLAAVENIAKASGGIGVILAESNKYFKFDEVYAVQLLILLTGILIDYLLNVLRETLFPHTSLK